MVANLPPHDPRTLCATLYGNQRLWLVRLAAGRTVPPPRHPAIWRSPCLTAAQTGQTAVVCLVGTIDVGETLPLLEQTLDWLRGRNSGDVLIWAHEPRPDLALAFAAHGLDEAFRPHWMTRPLNRHLPRPATGPDVDIHLASKTDLDALRRSTSIPYVNADQFTAIEALLQEPVRQRRVWLLVARERGRDGDTRVLGQAIVNLCDGPSGRFAGLYNLGVDPTARRQGIGTALTTAACNLARDLGAMHIGLNATPDGEPLYRTLGFASIGTGQTWLLPGRRLLSPPDDDLIRFALAIASGDPEALPASVTIPRHLANGESPLAFAARAGQQPIARWLLANGAPAEIVPLWALGLRDEAHALLADPEAVNRRVTPLHTSPLHEATLRGDIELARLLIAAGADLTATDDRYRSTPLGWAEALRQDEIAMLLRQAGPESQRQR